MTSALTSNRQEDALNIVGQNHKRKLWTRSSTSIAPRDVHLAALFGDIEVISEMIRCGVNMKDKWKDSHLTPIHCAAMGGYRDIAERLIEAYCAVDATSEDYGTPLCLAVLGERLDVVDLLLQHTPDLSSSCGILGSVIHAATATGNLGLLQALNGFREGLRAECKVRPQRIRMLRRALVPRSIPEQIKDVLLVDTKRWHSRLAWISCQPLALAAYTKDQATVEYLIAQKVDINAKCTAMTDIYDGVCSGSTNHTALSLASMVGSREIVQILLENHAVVTSRDSRLTDKQNEHSDMLWLAVLNGSESCALLLLEKGAPASSKTRSEAKKNNMQRLVAALSK